MRPIRQWTTAEEIERLVGKLIAKEEKVWMGGLEAWLPDAEAEPFFGTDRSNGTKFDYSKKAEDPSTLPSIKLGTRCANKNCRTDLPYVEDDGKKHYCWSCRDSGYDKE